MTWYNKYRPVNFDEVIGQNLVKEVLINSIQMGKIKHGYLLSGSKGIGKTTIARIFAGMLNDLDKNPEAKIDIIELDAASNTGIDNIRQLIESSEIPPIYGIYKIYIIDEVHMLSKPAMSALLKILEEPPSYLVFLLATTNPEKILPTVLSRLTKLNLVSHSVESIVEKLELVAKKEGVKISNQALNLIAKKSQGSLRDSLNLLETVASYNLDNYEIQKVAEILGLVDTEIFEKLIYNLSTGKISTEFLDLLSSKSYTAQNFLIEFLDYLIELDFANKYSNPELVMAVSQVISLDLPIDNLPLLLGVLQNHLPQKKTLNPNSSFLSDQKTEYTKKNSKSQTDETNSKPVISEPVEISNQIKETPILEKAQIFDLSNSKAKNEFQVNDNFDPARQEEKFEVFNDTQILSINFVDFLKSQTDLPVILKLILPDLKANLQDNTLNLQVSNEVFLAQLQSDSVSKYLKQKLENRGNSWVIATSLYAKEAEEVVPIEESFEISEEEVVEVENSNQQRQKKNIKSKNFYSVYKKLPKNVDSSQVAIWTEEIVVPKSQKFEPLDDEQDVFELE